jgi:ribosomal protein S21
VIVIPCEKKRVEYFLKEYRQKFEKLKIANELRERRYFEKPSQRRRKEKSNAIRRQKWQS